MESLKKEMERDGDAALKELSTAAQTLQDLLKAHFDNATWDSMTNGFRQGLKPNGEKNGQVSEVMVKTYDAANRVSELLSKLETRFSLVIPTIEDGNNFGVHVATDCIKKLLEYKKEIDDKLEKFVEYPKERAAAMEKLCEKSSQSTKRTETSTNVDTKKGKEPGQEEKATVVEEKVTSTSTDRVLDDYIEHVVAIDAKWCMQFKTVLTLALHHAVLAEDLLEKNMKKLLQPKGRTAVSTGMY